MELPNPKDEVAVDEFLKDDKALLDWLAQSRGMPPELKSQAVPRFLRRFSYLARSSEDWEEPGVEPLPELRLQVSSHSEIGGHTHYQLECALHNRGELEPFLAWRTARRLLHLRRGLHDPVKQALGQVAYNKHFGQAPFARFFGPAGTTSRLGSWLRALADCTNTGKISPVLVSGMLRLLDAPVVHNSGVESVVFGKTLVDRRPTEADEEEDDAVVEEIIQFDGDDADDADDDAELAGLGVFDADSLEPVSFMGDDPDSQESQARPAEAASPSAGTPHLGGFPAAPAPSASPDLLDLDGAGTPTAAAGPAGGSTPDARGVAAERPPSGAGSPAASAAGAGSPRGAAASPTGAGSPIKAYEEAAVGETSSGGDTHGSTIEL